jgi:hypothetical protein
MMSSLSLLLTVHHCDGIMPTICVMLYSTVPGGAMQCLRRTWLASSPITMSSLSLLVTVCYAQDVCHT